METATFYQWVKPAKSYQVHTRVTLDCGHEVVYNGVPEDAAKNIFDQGAITTRNGTSRCRPCHVAFAEVIFQALRTV